MKTDIRAAVGAKFARTCRFFLPGLAVFALIAAGTSAQTVDEIIAKNIQARGGMEKLKAIRTLRTTVKFSGGSFRAEFRQETSALARCERNSSSRAWRKSRRTTGRWAGRVRRSAGAEIQT